MVGWAQNFIAHTVCVGQRNYHVILTTQILFSCHTHCQMQLTINRLAVSLQEVNDRLGEMSSTLAIAGQMSESNNRVIDKNEATLLPCLYRQLCSVQPMVYRLMVYI